MVENLTADTIFHQKKMKTIALFGGTGKSGQEFLKMALSKGYKVKALARNPKGIAEQSKQLEIIKGDVLDLLTVSKVVEGADIVISLFGHVKDSPEWLQTNGTKNIVHAMATHSVTRIISLSGGGLPFPEKDLPKAVDKVIRFLMKTFAAKILEDAIKHAEVLKNSSLEWCIVRGPRLTTDEATGEYRVGWVGVNSGTKLSRADLADFILKEIKNRNYSYQMPFVSY